MSNKERIRILKMMKLKSNDREKEVLDHAISLINRENKYVGYRVTWIENDGSVSRQSTTCSEHLAKEWHKSGMIAKKCGYLKDCIFEDLTNGM